MSEPNAARPGSTLPSTPVEAPAVAATVGVDGLIEPDSCAGRELGFTSDKFEGWLWKTGDRVMVSMIVSTQPSKRNLSKLFDAIEARGFKVAVPTPSTDMREILDRKGFKPHMEDAGDLGPCEVWTK